MPRLRKHGKNGYYFAIFSNLRRKPREKTVALKTNRKDVAMRNYVKMVEQYQLGKFDPWHPKNEQPRITFVAAKEQFLASRAHLRPKTIEAYTTALEGLRRIIPRNVFVGDLRADHLKGYIRAATVSESTKRHRYAHLRTFFNWSVTEGLIGESPLKTIPIPKERKKLAEFLTPSQLERLLRAIDADYEMKRASGQIRDGEILWLKDLILVAVSTGMRRGELCSLRWSHVDFDSRLVNVKNDSGFITKSGNERSIPLVGDAFAVLSRRYVEAFEPADGYVFQSVSGGKLDGSFASKAFKRYVRLAKLSETIRFHSLRHTCASWLVQRGAALQIVQAILGHSSISVTQRYAHLAPDVLQSAMQAAFGKVGSS